MLSASRRSQTDPLLKKLGKNDGNGRHQRGSIRGRKWLSRMFRSRQSSQARRSHYQRIRPSMPLARPLFGHSPIGRPLSRTGRKFTQDGAALCIRHNVAGEGSKSALETEETTPIFPCVSPTSPRFSLGVLTERQHGAFAVDPFCSREAVANAAYRICVPRAPSA
jgi:hypothetical protein